jgi:hypothetical protein
MVVIDAATFDYYNLICFKMMLMGDSFAGTILLYFLVLMIIFDPLSAI